MCVCMCIIYITYGVSFLIRRMHYLTKKITSKNHLVRNQNLPRQEQVSLDLQAVGIVLAVAFVEELVVVAAAAFVEELVVVALIVD